MKAFDYLYFLLPMLLWPITFIVLRSVFVYSMLVSVLILASLTLYRNRKLIKWRTKGYLATALIGIGFAVALYLIFYFGNYLATDLGLGGSVNAVYAMLYALKDRALLVILLAFIGVFEEIYWRGGVQGYAEKKTKMFRKYPWVLSTFYYSLVHVSTLNPILVIAAFFVGIVTSLVAYKYGIVASTFTHIIWIEAVVVFLPIVP